MPTRKKLTLWILRSVFMLVAAGFFVVAPFQQAGENAGSRATQVLIAAIGLVIFNFECWTWWRRSAEFRKHRTSS